MTTIEGSDLFISCNTWPRRKIVEIQTTQLSFQFQKSSAPTRITSACTYNIISQSHIKRELFSWKRRNFNNQTKNFPMIYPRIEDFAEKMSNACAVLSLFGRLHRLTLRKARWPPFNFAIFSVSWRILSAHFQDKRCSPQNQEKRLGFFGKTVRHNLF